MEPYKSVLDLGNVLEGVVSVEDAILRTAREVRFFTIEDIWIQSFNELDQDWQCHGSTINPLRRVLYDGSDSARDHESFMLFNRIASAAENYCNAVYGDDQDGVAENEAFCITVLEAAIQIMRR